MKTEIEKKVNDSDSSFYWAMRLMPSKKRQAIFAVYAFCREVDDVADGNLSNHEKANLIKFWRTEIENIFAPIGKLTHGENIIQISNINFKRVKKVVTSLYKK